MRSSPRTDVDTRFLKSGRVRHRYRLKPSAVRLVNHAIALTGYKHDHTALYAISMDFLSRCLAASRLTRAVHGNNRFLVTYYPDEFEIVREALVAAREFVATDAEALVLMCQIFIVCEENDGSLGQGNPLGKSIDNQNGAHRCENLNFNARRHIQTKRRNTMSAKLKNVNAKNNPACIQPRLPVPKEHKFDDALQNTGCMIEKLDKENALKHAKLVWETRAYCAFHFGGVLSVIQSHKWYKAYGFSTFRDFVGDKFGISKSTAYDFISIYINLIEKEIPWKKIEHLGWTKIRLIGRFLTQKNLEEWIDIAQSKNAIELRDFVKAELRKEQSELIAGPPKLSTRVDIDDSKPKLISKELAESIPVRVVYTLFPEQKSIVDTAIERAMQASDNSNKNVALEYICMDYLSRSKAL